MVDQVEIKQPEETSEKPTDAAQDKTYENESRPEWLPEKFKSPQDMAKAYSELENKLGQSEPKDNNNKDSEPTKETKESDLSIDNAEKAVESAGLNMETLQQEYNESGELNEKSYVKDIDEMSGKIKDKLEELNSKIDKLDLS